MTTHVEHLRTALDAYDHAKRHTSVLRVLEASDELATRVRNLLEQIEGAKL